MSLVPPLLDDRKFQDLVDEAKTRIAHYCPEWTDHNVSDPGVTLIELFAWMTDLLLYRLNQVPQLHYIKFMQMLGIRLAPPVPAQAAMTFWLSKAQPSVRLQEKEPAVVSIPAGTEVATTQTETEPSVVFTTDRAVGVQAPQLVALITRVTRSDGQNLRDEALNLTTLGIDRRDHLLFSGNEETVPAVGSALYFGFATDLSHHILRLDLNLYEAGGADVNPDKPPYTWEAATGKPEPADWAPCYVEKDTTGALCKDGEAILHLPAMGRAMVNNQNLFWVRVRLHQLTKEEVALGVQPYARSPKLRRVVNEQCLGVTLPVTQAQMVREEYLGRSDGNAGQRYHLQNIPVLLPRTAGEILVVQNQGEVTQYWHECPDFATSHLDDPHYVLDSVSGEIRLGPAIRQRDGTIKVYGAIPPRGATLIFHQYRSGGGQRGNVAAGAINTLKSSIPFVERIENRARATGGLDAESLEAAMLKAAALLRTRERAVTADDFEFVAQAVLREKIARVKCIQPRSEIAQEVVPNLVYILVIARVDHPTVRLQEQQLLVPAADVQELARRLEERRPLTMRIEVRSPVYSWISVRVRVTVAFDQDRQNVERTLLTRLYHFINPIVGGEEGTGWPFGRAIYVADVYRQLPTMPGVLIRGVDLFEADREGTPLRQRPDESMRLVLHGVVASGRHWVEFVDAER